MDSFKIRDKKPYKANATLKHQRIQKFTTLFHFLELFIFFIIVSRVLTQLSFYPFNLSGEYFKGISVTLISPKFVFLVVNVIVAFLFSISGQLSAGEGEKCMYFYDECMDKCRNNRNDFREEEKIALVYEPKQMSRCRSDNLERAARGKDLRRSMSETSRKSGRKATEDEMSSEEFRRRVEAFIARQQRILKEEEEES